jgi:hypothetical protein
MVGGTPAAACWCARGQAGGRAQAHPLLAPDLGAVLPTLLSSLLDSLVLVLSSSSSSSSSSSLFDGDAGTTAAAVVDGRDEALVGM